MIYRDSFGYLTNHYGDGMDSAMRAGVMNTFNKESDEKLYEYVDKNGVCVRSPSGIMPESNPKNFTKDQLICLMAGLYSSHDIETCRKVYFSHAKRFFFAQNIERDLPGSTKYPWPHKMKNGDVKDNGKWRMFDYRDPIFLLPHQIWFMAKCAEHWTAYLLAPIGAVSLYLSLFFCSKKKDAEQNQIQCIVKTMGYFWSFLYLRYNPRWAVQTREYWDDRGEEEYADFIIDGMRDYEI